MIKRNALITLTATEATTATLLFIRNRTQPKIKSAIKPKEKEDKNFHDKSEYTLNYGDDCYDENEYAPDCGSDCYDEDECFRDYWDDSSWCDILTNSSEEEHPNHKPNKSTKSNTTLFAEKELLLLAAEEEEHSESTNFSKCANEVGRIIRKTAKFPKKYKYTLATVTDFQNAYPWMKDFSREFIGRVFTKWGIPLKHRYSKRIQRSVKVRVLPMPIKVSTREAFVDEKKAYITSKAEELNGFVALSKDSRWNLLQLETNHLKSVDICYKLLEEYPANKADIYQKLGVIQYFHIGDKKEAKSAFENSLEADNYNSYSLYMLGRINEDLGDYTAAEKFFKKASAAGRHNKLSQAKFYIRQTKFKEALDILDTCTNILYASAVNTYKAADFLKGVVYILSKDTARAKDAIISSEINKNNALVEIEKIRLPEEMAKQTKGFIDTLFDTITKL